MFDRIVAVQRTRLYPLETLFALTVLIAVNIQWFPLQPGFVGIEPNPYWIVVLAMAARYGRPGALFAGVFSSAVFATHIVLVGGIDAFADDLWLVRFPFLFLFVGFMIGEVRSSFILREDYLTHRIQELELLNTKISRENEIIREAHKDLTTAVAMKQETITMLGEITERVKSLDPAKVYQGILTSFEDFLGAEECSFYEHTGDELKLLQSRGWKDYQRRPERYNVGRGMVGLAAQERKPFCVKDVILGKIPSAAGRPSLMGDAVLTVPVIGLGDHIFGVASIEKMPFINLTSSTIQTAKVICELAASSLNTATTFRELKERQIMDEVHGLYKYHFFVTRTKEEFLRSSTYMIPLAAMAFRWPLLCRLPEDHRRAIIDSLLPIISSALRAFDVLARGPSDDIPLVLLLATTSGPQAETIKKRLVSKLNAFGLDKRLAEGPLEETISIVAYNPNAMHNAQDFLEALPR